ncbi:hypothetical protein [Mangrovibacterium sp.]|uniref:hypothetical protein n=1 Tax=Mangrovibacterium sp. TaxID=1961364 RepID=UPI003562A99D
MTTDNRIEKSIVNKKKLNYIFLGCMILVEFLILVALITILIKLWCLGMEGPDSIKHFYSMCAMGLMLLWIGILIAYYAWAIYFYNINMGLTNQDWAEIRERRMYVPEGQTDEPTENPNAGQTLGLPPGTVRGTIALTLLICGIALAIASLGFDSSIKANTFLVDNFDFFKTAFLMMIAFYFGNKALESIGYKSRRTIGPPGNEQTPENSSTQNPKPSGDAPLSPVTQAASIKKNELKQTTLLNPEDLSTGSDDFDNPKAVQ